MSSTAITTMVQMMEMLPESAQNQVVDHLRDYISEMQAEKKWDKLFKNTENQLIAAARQARQEVAKGHAKPLTVDQL